MPCRGKPVASPWKKRRAGAWAIRRCATGATAAMAPSQVVLRSSRRSTRLYALSAVTGRRSLERRVSLTAADATTGVVQCHYVYSDEVVTTRNRALDAAVELLGTEGLRALTHARVDARAGLPRGSTSNHFRTRRALLSGVVDHVAAVQSQEASGALEVATAGDLVDALCALLERATGPERTLTAARFALFVEAGHDPDLREPLARGRAAVEAP